MGFPSQFATQRPSDFKSVKLDRPGSFSIILPTRNRVRQLVQSLESLAALEFPRNRYEVIVIDDGGAENPAEAVHRYSDLMSVELIRKTHAGPAAARNAGIARSRGEWLAFIDDDCRAHPRWLEKLAARLDRHPGSAVGGHVVNALAENRYARTSQGLQDYLYRWYHEEKRGELRFFTTNNLAVARSDFDLTGPFDQSFPFASEDREWCDRAMHAGLPLVFAPEAIVYHAHELTFASFLRQHYRYGQGALRFHDIRAKRRGARLRLEPIAFYRGMLRAPFNDSGPGPVMDSLLLVLSQSASLLGFARDYMRNSEARSPKSAGPAWAQNSHPADPPRNEQATGVISGN